MPVQSRQLRADLPVRGAELRQLFRCRLRGQRIRLEWQLDNLPVEPDETVEDVRLPFDKPVRGQLRVLLRQLAEQCVRYWIERLL
jgi:hypothetical protein